MAAPLPHRASALQRTLAMSLALHVALVALVRIATPPAGEVPVLGPAPVPLDVEVEAAASEAESDRQVAAPVPEGREDRAQGAPEPEVDHSVAASLASLAATSAIPIITTTGHTSPHAESTDSATASSTGA